MHTHSNFSLEAFSNSTYLEYMDVLFEEGLCFLSNGLEFDSIFHVKRQFGTTSRLVGKRKCKANML